MFKHEMMPVINIDDLEDAIKEKYNYRGASRLCRSVPYQMRFRRNRTHGYFMLSISPSTQVVVASAASSPST